MIVRVEIDIGLTTLKFATGKPVNVADDANYLKKIEGLSEITKTGIFGDGVEVGNFSFDLIDVDDTYRGSAAVWYGAPVRAYIYDEELDGTWSLVEIARWVGVIAKRSKAGIGRVSILCTENHSYLGEILPANKIDSVVYPAASDSALGEYIQTLTGTFILSGGALVAWRVDENKYLLSDNTVVSVSGIFDPNGGAVVDTTLWRHQPGADLRSYIIYTPTEEQPEYIYVNCIATVETNPIDCLKAVLDKGLGTDVFFTGAAAAKSEMTTRGYIGAIAAGMGDSVGDCVDQFCRDFDCFGIVNDDGQLDLSMIDPVSVASYTDAKILGASETENPERVRNDVIFSWAYDYAKNAYNNDDNYIHPDSVTGYGRKTGEMEYYFTRDRGTALDVTRRRVRQLRELPRELKMDVPFSEQKDVDIGDVISVESAHLVTTGAHKYIVKVKRYNYELELVTLECSSYHTGMDYIIEVIKNNPGGTVAPSGIQVVGAGDDLTITVEADANHTIAYFWIDYTTYVTGETEYTFSDVSADHTFIVVFETAKYLIQASDDGNGAISPKGDVYVTAGADQAFSFTPGSGKAFDKFLIDGVTESTSNPYTFLAVAANHTIAAFSTTSIPQFCTITITKVGAGTVKPKDGGIITLQKGNAAYLIFEPAATSVVIDSVDVTSGNENGYYWPAVNADITVVATWS